MNSFLIFIEKTTLNDRIKNFVACGNNHKSSCKNKLKFLFIFLLLNSFFTLNFIVFHPYGTNIYNLNILLEREVIKNDYLKYNYNNSCFPTKKELFWERESNLHLNEVVKEIQKSKLSNTSFNDISNVYKRERPKISIIITIYNQAHYLKTLFFFIQKQELKDIEIICIDDASTDNTSLVIKKLMELDKRIIYLKNHINKKQFYSINIGILNSKGEYILSIDPDDLLLNNILIKAYKTAKYYNLDILQFYMLNGYKLWNRVKYISGIICGNVNVRKIFYYGISRNLPDKLIRRSIYIKSIGFMAKELYEMDYHMHTDDTIFFGIIHFANSYGFLEQIGYYYNQDSYIRRKKFIHVDKIEKSNTNLKSLFNIMKYFILKSDNNTLEKNNIPYKFFEKKVKNYFISVINYINKDFEFYIDVLNLYLDCPFFNEDKKSEINKVKNSIIKQKKKVNLNDKIYKTNFLL